MNEHLNRIGLDCGTGNFVAADDKNITLQRNVFITLDTATVNVRQLKLMNVPYIETNNRLYVVGKKAYEFAQIFNNKDLHRPMAQGLMVKEDVYGELGEIVNGWKQGREREDEITVMDSTGLAALDVVTFHYAYEKAIASGAGVELEL